MYWHGAPSPLTSQPATTAEVTGHDLPSLARHRITPAQHRNRPRKMAPPGPSSHNKASAPPPGSTIAPPWRHPEPPAAGSSAVSADQDPQNSWDLKTADHSPA